MTEISKNIKRQDLLMYVASSYYHFLNYKLNDNKASLQAFKCCKQRIKHLTKMPIEDINDIIYSVDIAKEPIKHIYYQLVEWVK